ncbi:hypothetical protein S83_062454 [Arachis hypogaea]
MDKLTKPILSPLPKFKSYHNFRNSHLSGSTLTIVRHPPPLHRHEPPLSPPSSLTLTVSPRNRRLPVSESRGRIVVAFSLHSLNVAAASIPIFVTASIPVSVATSSKILAGLHRRYINILAGLSRSLSVSLFAVCCSFFCLLVKNCKELDYHFVMPYNLSPIVLPAVEVSTWPAFAFLHHLFPPLLKASDDSSNEPFGGNMLFSTKKGIYAGAIGACHLEAIQGVTPQNVNILKLVAFLKGWALHFLLQWQNKILGKLLIFCIFVALLLLIPIRTMSFTAFEQTNLFKLRDCSLTCNFTFSKPKDSFIHNQLLHLFAKCSKLSYPRDLFDNTFVWNTITGVYAKCGDIHKAQ